MAGADAADAEVEPAIPAAPAGATVADLQAAAGVEAAAATARSAARAKDDGDDDGRGDDDDGAGGGRRRRRRWPIVVGLTALVGATIGALLLVGQLNQERYQLTCTAKQIVAERGRFFPPWGTARLSGPAWAPIAIPPAVECTSRDTDDAGKLEGWYLDALIEQATTQLSGGAAGDTDLAEAQLQQALLLARTPARRDARQDIERLLGDVTYWRGAARVKAATDALLDAAKRFDDAAARRPRHASDAATWAALARTTAAALAAGPHGAGAPPPPPGAPLSPPRSPAPAGVALPVEEPRDGGVAAPPPDAAPSPGLPAGGVLL